MLNAALFISSTFAQTINRTEEEWIKYLNEHADNLDPLEGIWSANMSLHTEQFNRNYADAWHVVIVKNPSGNYVEHSFNKGIEGDKEFTKTFVPTALNTLFIYQRYGNKICQKVNAVLKDNNIIEYTIESYDPNFGNSKVEWTLIRMNGKNNGQTKRVGRSGTGFAINATGYIVTNNHVVTDGNNITIKGIDGNFSKDYSAKVILTDTNNDLAIIKIDDSEFSGCGTIPYSIQSKMIDVGNSIFVLGYPLRAAMGDEVKLTNGIISSKTGFKGDVSTYQISAPVQPGNSGGPMFDGKGNIVGIVNAKFERAENATYAIKTSYLFSLIESLSKPIKLPSTNSLSGKSITEITNQIKNFTYIIEVN